MSKSKVMREVTITICDYCSKEIKDHNYTGSEKTDFHDMKSGGEYGKVKETCYEKQKLKDVPQEKIQ